MSFLPVRCFTCGAIIGNKGVQYEKLRKELNSDDEALNKMQIKRYCCRRMFLSNVDINDILLNASENSSDQIKMINNSKPKI